MRKTTLNIDDDALQAAKELAHQRGTSVGTIISELARQGILGATRSEPTIIQNGVPVLPLRNDVITPERVQRIMKIEAV